MEKHNSPPVEETVSTADGLKVITFGCRLNIHESEVMKNHARAAGITDAVIVNTCAVTGEAERQARQAIRRARRENPQAKIIVTGCAAQVHTGEFAGMGEIDHIIGNDLKLKKESWENLGGALRVQVNDIMSVKETAGHLVSGFEAHARAFVQVQNGCDHRCTFCIIPYGRGNSRSVPVEDVVAQVRELAVRGYREIVLTGVDITSYGADLPGTPRLGQMIRRVLNLVPDIRRVRLSSLDPVEIDDDLWRLIGDEPRFMPHLHLSLQAGDDMILKRMKRRHLRRDVQDVCARARSLRPDIVFGADIIAGFPTEDDAMFDNTLKIVDECGLTWLHVFPYSPRIGTPAAKMPQVDPSVRKERAARLREKGERRVSAFLQGQVGAAAEVLAEKDGRGHTPHFAPVRLSFAARPGDIVSVRMTGVDGGCLLGDAA